MSVTLRFCGATQTVTGSCYLLQTRSGRFLIDCGLFQGQKTLKELNYRPFPFNPADVDVALLTHAHIDHSGLLPKLTREGFKGRILATRGTIDLCSYMLPDAGSIQESEVAALNRRNAARRRPTVSPIYTQADALASLQSFRPVEYEIWADVVPGVRARYWNAGHLLGSASIELEFAGEGVSGQPLRLLSSGDIGPDAKLLQPDPEAPSGFDYVLSESTYGDRIRAAITPQQRRQRLAGEVNDAAAAQGALLIPAFAVERTQELIIDLVDLMERGEIPIAPIFLDSPLAIRATEVFRKHAASLDQAIDVSRLLSSPHLRFTETVDESKSIAKIKVAARIRMIDDYSGHADGSELARWIAARRPIQRGIFLVHGEEQAITGLAGRIVERIIPAALVFQPVLDDVYELSTPAPKLIEESRDRRRLPPQAVTNLDWHNDMSKLILDINERIDAAVDERARAVIIRKLRRALDELN